MRKVSFIIFYFLFSLPVFGIEINLEFLNQFNSVAIKTIRKSETTYFGYNNGGIYGIKAMVDILGTDKVFFNTEVIYLSNYKKIQENSNMIWHNSRPKGKSPNYRLKYEKIQPLLLMKEGDIILIGRVSKNKIKLIIAKKNSKYAKQITNLFDNEKEEIKENIIAKSTNSTNTDTSNLIEYENLKIYKNTKTNKIVISGEITEVKDGDTVVVSDLFNVRLFGIDAPEKQQICKDKNGKNFNCGTKSTKHLKKIIGSGEVICVNNGIEKYGRFIFVCKNDKYDINRKMVQDGWAISYYNNEYKKDEILSKKNKKGLWAGKFEVPSKWRKNKKNKTNNYN